MTSPAPPPDPQAEPTDPAAVIAERDERIAQLQLANKRANVSHETGIPEELLAGATTPEQVDEIAGAALGWQLAAGPPPPPTAAVLASEVTGSTGVISAGDRAAMNPRYSQIQTRDAVSRLSPAELLAAWRSGQLSSVGVGAPVRNGGTPLTRRR